MTTTADSNLIRGFEVDQRRRGLRPTTMRVRRVMLVRASIELPEGLSGATRRQIETWLDSCALCSRSRRSYLSHLRAFYAWAVDNEWVETNPAARIMRPRVPRSLPRPIPRKELAYALGHADATMRCWLLLGAFGGLRCQEIAGIDREDVLEDEGLLRITQGKGGIERVIPLHPELLAALRALPMPARGALFLRPQGHDRYTAGPLSHALNDYLHSLGIKSTAHSLRHWFGTETYKLTRDLRLTQELLGHRHPSTTAIYVAYDHRTAGSAVYGLSIEEETA